MENNKFTRMSQIFAFISMGFGIVSIPFYFFGSFSISLFNAKDYITLITLFKQALSADDGKAALLVCPIFLVIAIVFTVAASVLGVFKVKATKITAAVLHMAALIIDLAVIISTSNKMVSIDYGAIIIIVAMVIAAAMSVFSMAFILKRSHNDEFILPPVNIPSEYIGGNDDTVVIRTNGDVQNIQPQAQCSAKVTFLSGCCAGFEIPISDNGIIVGKDPAQCSIVISANYTNISRKHCKIDFDAVSGNYIVTDFSANGTFTEEGMRIPSHVPQRMPKNTILTLAKTDNILKLG